MTTWIIIGLLIAILIWVLKICRIISLLKGSISDIREELNGMEEHIEDINGRSARIEDIVDRANDKLGELLFLLKNKLL